MKKLFLLFLLIANMGFAQSNDFDKRIRARFPNVEIPTDRKFDINTYFYPADEAIDAYVFGKFFFLTYIEEGVNLTQNEKDKFAEAFKQAAAIYDECIEIPYTVPVFVQFGIDNGCYASSLTSDNMEDTSGQKTVSKILRGDKDSYLQIWINSNLDMFVSDILEDGYYVLKEGEGDAYLPMVIAHELFHGLAQSYNLLENYTKSYGTICEQEGHNKPKQHTHPTTENMCYSELYYNGENAVKANGGFPVQTEQMHFNLVDNLIETVSANSLIDINKIYIWNHVGPVSLGLLQDVGYKVKEDYMNSEYIQPYYGKPSWIILDKNGDSYGCIVLGKIQGLSPECEEKYNNNDLLEIEKLRPYLEARFNPTGIEDIEGAKVYTKDGSLYVQTPTQEQVQIISVSGAVLKNETQIGLRQYTGLQRGVYIICIGEQRFKVRL